MSKRRSRPSILRRLGVGTAALAFAAITFAQQRELNIPGGDLAAAIEAYIAATGQQVIYKVDDVKGKRSNGVRGSLPPDEALRQLVAGTRLNVKRDASGAMVLFAEAAAASAAPGERGAAAPVEPQTVVITAKPFSHLGERNRTGTRTDTDPMDLAQSVTTVKRQLIEEQQASDLRQILANVAGVSATPGRTASGFSARGLEASVVRNGALADSSSTRSNLPSFAIEQVEVVRGAESVIGGQAAGYGGVINVITKAANGERQREAQVRLGSHGLRAVGLDVGDVVPGLPELSVRLVAESERNGRTSVGYDGAKSDYAAASAAWEGKASGTTVLADLYSHRSRTAWPGFVFAQTLVDKSLEPLRFPWQDAGLRFEESAGSLTLSQRIGQGWSARLRVEQVQFETSSVLVARQGNDFPVFTAVRAEQTPFKTTTDSRRLELLGTLNLGALSNNVLLGFDNTRNRFGSSELTDVSSVLFDARDGSWTDNSADNGLPGFPIPIDAAVRTERGLVLQNQWYWGDQWAGLLAARHIDVEFFGDKYTKWLPSVGIVYRATETLSVYTNSTRSTKSNAGFLSPAGERLPDEYARSRELGAKAILGGGKVALTGALYEIRRQKAATPDFDNDPSFFLIEPTLYSRGVELEASGSTGVHWSWRLGLTTNRLVNEEGVRQTGYAPRAYTAYLRYGFSGDDLGWWTSLLLNHQTSSEAGRKPRTQVDLGAGYSGKRWSLTAAAKSVAARRLLDGNGITSAVVDQERGLNVMTSLKF